MLDKWVSFAGTIVYWIGAKIAGWLWKVLNSAMIDCFKLGKGMQRLHRSFSSKLLNKPINRSYEILRKGNGTSRNDYIYIFKKNLWRKLEWVQIEVMLTQPSTHPEELFHIWRVCVAGYPGHYMWDVIERVSACTATWEEETRLPCVQWFNLVHTGLRPNKEPKLNTC